MKKTITIVGFLCSFFSYSQIKKDTTKQKEVKEVILVGRKPTVENKVDRTIFNVSKSSILAGNTTWEILRMTPLVSIDQNDAVKAEGEAVTVYINDRKSVFKGKELKEYLKTIPAENLLKIEVITSPSARYESAGSVINIVLKKMENEGMKGSLSVTNTQQQKNSQYSNLNLNYHRKNFTQTLTGSYSNNLSFTEGNSENYSYADKSLTNIYSNSTTKGQTPSISSTSELELNDKNNLGLIFEFFKQKNSMKSISNGNNFIDDNLQRTFSQSLYNISSDNNFSSNVFYKFYDKPKNKILDINVGLNHSTSSNNNPFTINQTIEPTISENQILSDNKNKEYYLKVDYTQPFEKSGMNLEFGGKIDFKNNVMLYKYKYENINNNNNPNKNLEGNSNFQYLENLNSAYANLSKTLFKKLETRIGLRYEYINYTVRQDVENIEKNTSYGTWLPDILLKYIFTENFNISTFYNRNIWRPYYVEFNPFLIPNDNGTYRRGNIDLQPNPSNRIGLKIGLYKKYFISTSYWFSNQDYWYSMFIENQQTINMPINFNGAVKKYYVNFNTNQTFFKNKLSINLSLSYNYTDNSDFNAKNRLLNAKNYFSNLGGSTNMNYSNIFNKNINLTAWVGAFNQNSGNFFMNRINIYHNISATKIFPKLEMEATLRFNNIFMNPNFDATTYSEFGTFRNLFIGDQRGVSLVLVKRFGNQKVKENTKTNVEKDSGGSK